MPATALPSLFWAKVDKTGPCWIWTGALQSRGYGSYVIAGRTHLAHRLAYTATKGEIPTDLTIDHLCRVKRCVNPDHLEAVTIGENIRRTGHGSETHCKRGHELSGPNLRLKSRGAGRSVVRNCWTCTRPAVAA